MSDILNAVSGPYGERMSDSVGSASVIEVGDAVIATAATGVPYAAKDETWSVDLATTQENAHDKFLGIALQRSRSGDTDPIRVATTGVFVFDCAAATFKIGDLVGLAKQTGNALENKKVVAVATANLAIGRVAKDYNSNTTKVEVQVMGTLQTGGAYAPA